MAQGSYKTLLWKLSGTALGFVVMLSVATMVSQNFISEEDNFASFDAEFSQKDQDFKRALNEEFRIVVESGVQARKKSSLATEDLEAEILKNMIVINAHVVKKISDAIIEVTSRVSIPADVKEVLLAGLERQLEKNLNELENRVLNFSYEMILPKLSSYNGSKCSQSDIAVGKTTGQIKEDSNTRGTQKNATEAFYWI